MLCMLYLLYLLTFFEGQPKLKSREELEKEGHTCLFKLLTERFKLDKNYDFPNEKTVFELALCTDNKPVITNMCKLLLKINMEAEYVKDCMIKCAIIGYNAQSMGEYVSKE